MTTCCARCDFNDREEKRMLDDDALLDARDMAAEMMEAKGQHVRDYDKDNPATYGEYCVTCGFRLEWFTTPDASAANFHCTNPECSKFQARTCATHEGMRLPCPLSHDDATCDDIDQVLTQLAAQERTFETLINEWTEACRAENNKLPNELAVVAAACPAFLRLSALGMRLIYESNHLGMQTVMKMTKEKLSGL